MKFETDIDWWYIYTILDFESSIFIVCIFLLLINIILHKICILFFFLKILKHDTHFFLHEYIDYYDIYIQ